MFKKLFIDLKLFFFRVVFHAGKITSSISLLASTRPAPTRRSCTTRRSVVTVLTPAASAPQTSPGVSVIKLFVTVTCQEAK